MNELLLPGSIISSRTRVRLDGTSITKLVLDKADQHFLEERVPAIKAAYKKLAAKDIEIDFQKEATYYVLKKGERRWFHWLFICIAYLISIHYFIPFNNNYLSSTYPLLNFNRFTRNLFPWTHSRKIFKIVSKYKVWEKVDDVIRWNWLRIKKKEMDKIVLV